jgi:hypothetical protein
VTSRDVARAKFHSDACAPIREPASRSTSPTCRGYEGSAGGRLVRGGSLRPGSVVVREPDTVTAVVRQNVAISVGEIVDQPRRATADDSETGAEAGV